MSEFTRDVIRIGPGLVGLVVIALGAKLLSSTVPGMNALLVAVAIGGIVTNTVGLPDRLKPGVSLHSLFLETGIVLLGVSVSLEGILRSGPHVIALAVAAVVFGVLTVEVLARVVFDLTERTASLLAAGSSICGVSGVVAVAGAIDADETQIAYATATILLFDALTLVLFPILGEALQLSDVQFGIWAGISMFSTGPVAAAGFAHSEIAGQWATLTKLIRNSLIGVVAVSYSLAYSVQGNARTNPGMIWNKFPKFLFGFFAVGVAANIGLLSPASIDTLDALSEWLFIIAFAGLGTGIQIDRMRDTGIQPILTVFGYLVIISILAFFAVTSLT